MKRTLILCLAILALQANIYANNITGTMQTSSGTKVADATMTLTLSQAGIVAGSFALASSPSTCGTDTAGVLRGITRPIVAPSVVASTSSGTVPSGTYFIKISYVTAAAAAETEASPAATATLSSAGHFDITAPTLHPNNAVGYRVYVGTVAGSEKLQATTLSFITTTISSYNAGGAALPTNSTVCAITFNDSIIPSFTWYRVSVVTSSATTLSGFPQNWYLAGASVDISTQYPLAAVTQQTRFPTPLLATPSSNAQQSVNSPVSLGGYALTAGALQLPANASPPACQGTTSLIYTDVSGVLKFCQNGANITGMLDWFDNATTSIIGNQLLISSRARVNPAANTYLQLMWDTGIGGADIVSRNYSAASPNTMKPMAFEASSFTFQSGDPGATALSILSTALTSTLTFSAGTAATTVSNGDGYSPRIIAAGNSTSSGIQSIRHTTVGTLGGALILGSTRGTDANSYTIVQTGDGLGMIEFAGADGTTYQPAGRIVMTVAATPGATDMPGNLSFQTTPDGSATPSERMSISTAGLVTVTAGGLTSTAGTTTLGTTNLSGKRLALAKGADVASAGDLTLGTDGNLFHITGTTTINAITTANWQSGSRISLIFDGSVTVKHNTAGGGGTAKMLLSGAADFAATSNDVLELIFDGTSWFEAGRTVI